jgi:amino acid transporter
MAYGPFWGFQQGWLSYLSGVADNSLYPILLLDTFVSLVAIDGEQSMFAHGLARTTFIMCLTAVLTYLNYRGLDIVGQTTTVVCLLTLMPFVVLCVIGAFQVDPARWLVTPEDGLNGVNWRLFLNTFFWNINYWDSVSCFATEVDDPGKTYPKAMLLAVLLVGVSTFFPVLICTGASEGHYSKWKDGYFTALGVEIGGPWLGLWLMFAACITNVGTFEAEMSSDAWQVAGMADRGIIPKFMGTRNAHGTPTYGILLSASGVLVLCWLSFAEVIEMLNILYCIAQLQEFSAFIYLRYKYPDLPRPFRIPLGTVGVSVMLAVPALFAGVIIAISSRQAFVTAIIVVVLGVCMRFFMEYMKEHKWVEFDNEYAEAYDLSEVAGEGYGACERGRISSDEEQSGGKTDDASRGSKCRSGETVSLLGASR